MSAKNEMSVMPAGQTLGPGQSVREHKSIERDRGLKGYLSLAWCNILLCGKLDPTKVIIHHGSRADEARDHPKRDQWASLDQEGCH